MIGYAVCGSFCTHAVSLKILSEIRKDYDVLTIVSFNASSIDTRFGRSAELIQKLESISEKNSIKTIAEAEPLGPKIKLDALIISPCTGNTLSKLAHGVTDTPVTMAAKAHLRSNRPLIIALATNDALSANLVNIGNLLNRKNVYFVPMIQDDPIGKPHSLVADFSQLRETFELAMKGEQLRPMFIK